MSSENYKLYRKHKVEIFDMIYDVFERSPVVPDIFGFKTEVEKQEDKKKMENYLKTEEQKFRERLKEMGFNSK